MLSRVLNWQMPGLAGHSFASPPVGQAITQHHNVTARWQSNGRDWGRRAGLQVENRTNTQEHHQSDSTDVWDLHYLDRLWNDWIPQRTCWVQFSECTSFWNFFPAGDPHLPPLKPTGSLFLSSGALQLLTLTPRGGPRSTHFYGMKNLKSLMELGVQIYCPQWVDLVSHLVLFMIVLNGRGIWRIYNSCLL